MLVETLIPYYQPIIDTWRCNKPIGFEATVRSQDANGKVVYFKNIYDQAQKVGKSIELDLAARDISIRSFVDKLPKNLKLFVNGSPSALELPLFYEDIDISRIVLEITENEKIMWDQRSFNRLLELKKRGLELAIDDFGAGFTNFRILNDLSVDYIKLDKYYTHNLLKTKKFVQSLNLFSQGMNAKLIVEGIEDQAQYEELLDLGIRYMQGFFFDVPKKSDEIVIIER